MKYYVLSVLLQFGHFSAPRSYRKDSYKECNAYKLKVYLKMSFNAVWYPVVCREAGYHTTDQLHELHVVYSVPAAYQNSVYTSTVYKYMMNLHKITDNTHFVPAHN